ncbi:U4/U6.U5 tri-snRNP-associated protein 2-like [Paramacrobiotus metropolitanus]|uniref:U4/U6.U5 tri-snRNP-associated protein 2-like n=1 Tax=Paramacrobiotus metropolitanus TaxID=2943436 RepID=UPI002445DDE8|nr:U4/U6.U5 tri-snRNP-associated protein 2-like [Paramacrobiotus metropolitanus]
MEFANGDRDNSKSGAKREDMDDVERGFSDRPEKKPRSSEHPLSRNCPYLDTINRAVLDFDFEKLCSVSLSHLNVYACLVCGKYFQGRGNSTHAYTHSVEQGHHVFLNLSSLRFYCLPDGYEILTLTLEDITFNLKPHFSDKEIKEMDTDSRMAIAYDGSSYLPGVIGLNNIKANDYCNVVFQALSHVRPIRNYFLKESNYAAIKRPPGDNMIVLVQRFGELLRKLWNRRKFKAHVSPHEMLQAVVLCSKKKFQFTVQGDSVAFLSWFLNAVHQGLNGTSKPGSSVIFKTFQGMMNVYSKKLPPLEMTAEEKSAASLLPEYQETVQQTPYLMLTCDLPPVPLFPDEKSESIIPQIPLYTLMQKFNGVQEKEQKTYKDSTVKRFEITKLPPYLIVSIRRFNNNTFFIEKNTTIVNFPIRNFDFGDLLTAEAKKAHKCTVYDLIANIVHDGEASAGGKGTYRVFLLHKGTSKWFEMQDLHVTEVLPQMITLSESYIQVWERQDQASLSRA